MNPQQRSHLFVSIAIIASVYILFSGPLFINIIPILLSQICALLFIVWAVLSIKFNRHQHAESLPEGHFFVTKGIYEIIRHPIYAGFLLFLAGYVNGAPSFLRYVALTIIFIVIVLKMLLEEKVLETRVKEYKEYQKKTHKLIPYLY